MLKHFPKYFSNSSMQIYFIGVIVCLIVFMKYSMEWFFYFFGAISVLGFFYFFNQLSISWKNISEKKFIRKVFFTALILRIIWVVFSYHFFVMQTGRPFDWGAADAVGYNECGTEIAAELRTGNFAVFSDYQALFGVSDLGYMSYLGILYSFTGDSMMIARLFKALYGALMCLLLYRLAARNFGESTGRMAGIMCMLMPNFIYYCGLHLKEAEMVFITVAFVERADYLLRGRKFNFINITIPLLLSISLFFFRTVLGITALMSFFTAIVFSSVKVIGWGKRILVGVWLVAVIGFFLGGKIASEVEEIWEERSVNQEKSMAYRAGHKGGNQFAKYGTTAIFAPMIFTIPFPSVTSFEEGMVSGQLMLNGGNYVKNITSFFTILGIFLLIFRKKWRENLLILSFLVGYLGIIAMSAFAMSERFHYPSVPFALIIAAYGISQMDEQKRKYFNWWTIFMFFAIIGWSWFKLAGRGII